MDEHLASWQISEFTLGGLGEDELEAVYRHLDVCVDCVGWRAGVIRVAATSESRAPGAGLASLRLGSALHYNLNIEVNLSASEKSALTPEV